MTKNFGIEPLVLDSITALPANAVGCVVLAASHGGVYSAAVAATAQLRAVILHDAGIGLSEAGIAGLKMLARIGMPAAAIDYRSARIGDGTDCLARGVISAVNDSASALGLQLGQSAQEAMGALLVAPPPQSAHLPYPAAREARAELAINGVAVQLLDSNFLVRPDDKNGIVVTGSHGGLLGGRVETAVKAPVFAAAYNDAGVGIDHAGISRLPVLDERGIAGITVSALSARIGDARSTYENGIVSFVNATAASHGVQPSQTMRQAIDLLVEAWGRRFRKDAR